MVSRSALRFASLGVLLALALPACGGPSGPGATTAPSSATGLARAPTYQVEESALTFVAGGREVHAHVTPDADHVLEHQPLEVPQ